MKWTIWENCLISEDKRVLKADSIEQLPKKLECVYVRGFNYPEYQAKISMKARYSDPYSFEDKSNYDYRREYIGITFESGNKKTVIDNKLLKKFIQKSSKFFLGQDESPLIIQNKNYVVMVAPCVDMGKVITYLPLN